MKDSQVKEATSDSAAMHHQQQHNMIAIAESIQQQVIELREEIKKLKDEMKVLRTQATNYYEKGMTIP